MIDNRTGSVRAPAPGLARNGTGIARTLLVATPFLMIASREIPATMLVAVTAFLAASAVASGNASAVLRDLRAAASTPGGVAALALVALAALSVAWSPTPVRGATHALHFGGSLLLAAIAIAVVLRMDVKLSPRALALALGGAALVTAIDLASASALRGALSLAIEDFRLNRVAVAIALFLPLVCALLVAERRFFMLAATWALGIVAIGLSISHSAKFGILVGALVLLPGLVAPRFVHRIVSFAVVAALLAMPLLAPIANSLVPARVHDAVGYGSLTIRGEIWSETAPFVWRRPIFGWGIEASHALPRLPEAAGLSPERLALLDYSHPHNAPLQIWLELGLVGALLAAITASAGMSAIARLPKTLLPYATATAASAFAIACVSHGAWQAWWWGLLGLLAVGYAAACELGSRRLDTRPSPGRDRET